MFPTDFARFFRLRATTTSGDVVVLKKTGIDYMIDGYRLRVVGLADLGRKQDTYDDCYTEDEDNYIDIMLDGDAAAARRITTVQIPHAARIRLSTTPAGQATMRRQTCGSARQAPRSHSP